LTAVSWFSWKAWRRRASRSQEILFALLAAPMLVSAGVVAFFVVPSFLFFEPDGDEPTSWFVRACACVGFATVMTGVVRAFTAWLQSSRAIRRWSEGAAAGEIKGALPILTTETSSPAAVVVGIARPRLLISRRTTETLSSNELRLVVEHEMEHARRRDNLRKLLLATNFMPFHRAIEDRWTIACELAADRAAVENGYDACDLAAALVKVSRMTCLQSRWAMAFAAATPDVLELRVQQLICWKPDQTARRKPWVGDVLLALIGGTAGLLLVFSGDVLRVVHRVSEFWIN
jgi:beta-lactamase regulating signal transducer with metallopeptidase domain